MQNNKKENLIVETTLEFALRVIKYVTVLQNKKEFVISKQLLRSATSIGACVREAQNAESKADFIHKMKIAAKEADETEYWLMLCNKSEGFPDCNELLVDCLAIIKILSKIISSSKKGNVYS